MLPFLAVRLSGRPRSALLWEEASARKAFVRRRATSPTEHADGRRDGPAGNAGRAQHRPGGGGTCQRRRRAWRSGCGGRVDGVKPRQSWPAASAARRASPHVILPRRQPMRRAVRAISAMPPCSSSPQLFIDDSSGDFSSLYHCARTHVPSLPPSLSHPLMKSFTVPHRYNAAFLNF